MLYVHQGNATEMLHKQPNMADMGVDDTTSLDNSLGK